MGDENVILVEAARPKAVHPDRATAAIEKDMGVGV